jgi:DNA-binding response OmpR family regulator
MSIARPILIIEDNDELRAVLMEHLGAENALEPAGAATLAEALRLLSSPEARFDAIVLDVNLPDGDGRDFCVQLRHQGYTMPIIMLTGTSEETDVVRGLNAGANDYISKPFRAKELLARIYAQLRLFDNSVDAVFTIGPYTFRPSAKILANPEKKQRIRLTNKEVELLKFLYQTSNGIVSRQTLLDEVWGYNAGASTHTLETHIYRLRQKLETDPAECRLLVTMPGGYQLNTPTRLAAS